jgi:predicted transcriptional regulator
MAKKRERLEVIYDILKSVQDERNNIKPTRLLYSSNLSPQMFREYIEELTRKGFIRESIDKDERKYFSLTDKGFEFLAQYKTILQFIESFGL